MKRNNIVFIGILATLLAISLFFNIRNHIEIANIETVSDTTRFTVIDTVVYRYPIPVDSIVVRYVTANLPIAEDGNKACQNILTNGNIDVENIPDSVNVIIPISQNVYEDSTYKAWISGYHTTIDSIYVFPRNEVITIITTPKKKRWHIGSSVGYGITPDGLQPYVGLSVTYSIISF